MALARLCDFFFEVANSLITLVSASAGKIVEIAADTQSSVISAAENGRLFMAQYWTA